MFDLEIKIAEWCLQLNQAGLQSATIIDELESHLRDDIEHQMRHGVPVEKAFASATARMGAPKALRQEFSRMQTFRELRRGKETGIFHLTIAGIYELVGLTALVSLFSQTTLTRTEEWTNFASLGAALLVSFRLWQLRRMKFPVLSTTIQLCGSALALLWVCAGGAELMARLPFAPGPFQGFGWWSFAPGFVWSLGTFIEMEKRPVLKSI